MEIPIKYTSNVKVNFCISYTELTIGSQLKIDILEISHSVINEEIEEVYFPQLMSTKLSNKKRKNEK